MVKGEIFAQDFDIEAAADQEQNGEAGLQYAQVNKSDKPRKQRVVLKAAEEPDDNPPPIPDKLGRATTAEKVSYAEIQHSPLVIKSPAPPRAGATTRGATTQSQLLYSTIDFSGDSSATESHSQESYSQEVGKKLLTDVDDFMETGGTEYTDVVDYMDQLVDEFASVSPQLHDPNEKKDVLDEWSTLMYKTAATSLVPSVTSDVLSAGTDEQAGSAIKFAGSMLTIKVASNTLHNVLDSIKLGKGDLVVTGADKRTFGADVSPKDVYNFCDGNSSFEKVRFCAQVLEDALCIARENMPSGYSTEIFDELSNELAEVVNNTTRRDGAKLDKLIDLSEWDVNPSLEEDDSVIDVEYENSPRSSIGSDIGLNISGDSAAITENSKELFP